MVLNLKKQKSNMGSTGLCLRSPSFLIYINDLHSAIKHSLTYHFADDTSLLLVDNSYKTIKKNSTLTFLFFYNHMVV